MRSARSGPVVTYVILGLMAVGFVIGLLAPTALILIAFVPELTLTYPWTMLTYPFANVSVLSLLINGLVMFLLGRQAEESLGRARFIGLLLISTFAGAVAMLMFVPSGALLGSSPAIWGLFGVILIYARSQGANVTGLLVMLALFIIIGLVVGTTWQASVGGLVGGATVTLVYTRLGAVRQIRERRLALAGIVAGLVVIAAVALII
jgi:membrane associated rhomboid family serine protease